MILSVSFAPNPAPTPSGAALIKRIFNRKRQFTLSPLNNQSFVSRDGITPCTDANRYLFLGGQLTDMTNQVLIAAPPDLSPLVLNNPSPGTFSTDIEIVNNITVWRNSTFFNGVAVFCVQNGIVYATFNSSGPPAGCLVVNLVVVAGESWRGRREPKQMLTSCVQ